MKLTLQLADDAFGWNDAAEIDFFRTGSFAFSYTVDHVASFLGRVDSKAISVRLPVSFDQYEGDLLAFILDLVPQGPGLTRQIQRFEIQREDNYAAILAGIPLAPPGNIRVKPG